VNVHQSRTAAASFACDVSDEMAGEDRTVWDDGGLRVTNFAEEDDVGIMSHASGGRWRPLTWLSTRLGRASNLITSARQVRSCGRGGPREVGNIYKVSEDHWPATSPVSFGPSEW